jgi:hypothetical protein
MNLYSRKIIVVFFTFLIFCLPVAGKSPLGDALEETTKQIEEIWGENACETVILKKKGHPLASIACNGSYSATQREKLLNVLLRNFFSVRNEQYRLRPQHGMYLYRTTYGNRTVYFKLFMRNAFDLWPKNPVEGKQIALYVQNVRAANDLVKWRTLGIPVTFGVTADGSLLTIGEALDAQKLSEYLKDLENDDGITGMSPLYCSRFCKNVPALRALFNALREKNDGKEVVLLDTDPHSESSFYETGRIMNFRTFRAQVMPGQENNFCAILTRFAENDGVNATRVMAVDAADDKAFACLKLLARTAKLRLEFVRVSSLSVTNPFR